MTESLREKLYEILAEQEEGDRNKEADRILVLVISSIDRLLNAVDNVLLNAVGLQEQFNPESFEVYADDLDELRRAYMDIQPPEISGDIP